MQHTALFSTLLLEDYLPLDNKSIVDACYRIRKHKLGVNKMVVGKVIGGLTILLLKNLKMQSVICLKRYRKSTTPLTVLFK